jgi:ankyrin repeat protein
MKPSFCDISSIHNAAFSADSDALGRCLLLGENVNKRTVKGKLTPLHYAAMGNYIGDYLEYYGRYITAQDYLKVIKQLVGNGANPLLTDTDGRVPAVIAWQQAAVLEDSGDEGLKQEYLKLARYLEKLR